MANRIKGITIEIGGDTTKLDKALSGTNKTISQTQKELKDVERLLKLDPGNTELLQQKQRLLAQAVEATADKLDTLRQAAENADNALQKGKDYQAAYEPLKNELDSVTASLRGLEANAESMQQQLSTGKISSAQYDAFQQKLDQTRKRAEELEQSIRDVNKEFSGRIDQSQYEAIQREIIETENTLKDLEKQAENSSVAVGKIQGAGALVSEKAGKISSAMQPVTTAIAGIGAAAVSTVPATEDLRASLGTLETNAQMVGVSLESAQSAFQQLNTVSGEMDSSLEAVSNLLQAGFTESNLQMAVEGLANAAITFPDTIKIESLADSLQETLATGEATGQFAELLDRVGYGTEKFAENLQYCTTQAEKQELAINILTQGALKDSYNAWADNNEELIANRDATLEFKIALAELAEQLTPIVTKVTEIATAFVDWFTSLDDDSRNATIAIAVVAASISPLAKVVETVTPKIEKFLKWFSGLGTNGKIAAIAFGALVTVIGKLALAWDDMTGGEKVVGILASVTTAALIAAVALGAFQSALTLGVAIAAIVAGIATLMITIDSATERAKNSAKMAQQGLQIPGLAKGGVVPPNNPFLAVLGDNPRETEIVSPYSTIKQAAGEAIAENGGSGVSRVEIVVRAKDGFTRNLSYSLSEESRRRGVRLVNG